MKLTAGIRLSSHEMLTLLGQSGTGEVCQVHDTKLGREVVQGDFEGSPYATGLRLVLASFWYGKDEGAK